MGLSSNRRVNRSILSSSGQSVHEQNTDSLKVAPDEIHGLRGSSTTICVCVQPNQHLHSRTNQKLQCCQSIGLNDENSILFDMF